MRAESVSVGGRFSSPYNADHVGQRGRRHWKKVEEESSVLWKQDYVALDSEIRRLISFLEPDNSADDVCGGDKEFLDPGEVL